MEACILLQNILISDALLKWFPLDTILIHSGFSVLDSKKSNTKQNIS